MPSLLEHFIESESIFEVYLKDTNKRARNMKFTSIFFKASAVYLRDLSQRRINEREIWSLLQYFSQRYNYLTQISRISRIIHRYRSYVAIRMANASATMRYSVRFVRFVWNKKYWTQNLCVNSTCFRGVLLCLLTLYSKSKTSIEPPVCLVA